MAIIQIDTKSDLKELADSVMLNVLYQISKSPESKQPLESFMTYIKTTCGEEAYASIKDGFSKVLEQNISGIKAFKADLIEWLINNNNKKFEIKIVEKNEDNSI